MDIEKIKKYITPQIEAGRMVNIIRETIKKEKHAAQDLYEGQSQRYKPILDEQKEIDEKQNKIIKQLQSTQKAITSGFEDLITYDKLPEIQYETTKLPIGYKPSMSIGKEQLMQSDLDRDFTAYDASILKEYELPPPSIVMKMSRDDDKIIDRYIQDVNQKLKTLGGKKGTLSKNKKSKEQNKEEIFHVTNEIKSLQKYKKRIGILEEGKKTLGSGIYNQPKRNAYKINQSSGQYGNLTIDIPKLLGQLKLVAYKNGRKVYDKRVDFDTLDLITKRYNAKKNYSDLSKMVFNELNTLSEIPIHRTSKKFSKIGSGVIYYNDPNDLISRLELLGGSISAGNNSIDVKNEFTGIVHTLNKLGIISEDQLTKLIQEYII